MKGPKSYTDEEKEKIQVEVGALEHKLYSIEDSAKDICESFALRTDDFAVRIRELLHSYDLDNLVQPSVKELFFSADSPHICTRGIAGLEPVSEEAEKVLQYCIGLEQLDSDLEGMRQEYQSAFDSLTERVAGLKAEHDDILYRLLDHTMIISPFGQELKEDVVLYLCDPRNQPDVYRIEFNLVTDAHSGIEDTNVSQPFILSEGNVERMRAEADEGCSSVYVVQNYSSKVPVDRMLIHTHRHILDEFLDRNAYARAARRSLQADRKRVFAMNLIELIDSMLEKDRSDPPVQSGSGRPVFVSEPGEEIPQHVLDMLENMEPEDGYDC